MAISVLNTSAALSGKTLITAEAASSFTGLANTGLKVLDTDASHAVSFVPGSNITAARTITFVTGDADRSLDLSLLAGINQALATTASPTFANLTITTNFTASGGTSTLGTLTAGTTTITGVLSVTASGGGAGEIGIPSAAKGTGGIGGKLLVIGRNSSGNGAAGSLSLVQRGGTAYFLWVDATGDLRIGTARPTEDNTTVSDTSGTVVGTQT